MPPPTALKLDVEKAILLLNNGKSTCVDNIPAEVLKHGGGPGVIKEALTVIIPMSENLDQWTIAQRLDTVAECSTSQKGNTRLPELQNDEPD